MKAIATATGIVMIGMSALGMCHRKIRMIAETIDQLFDQRVRQVVDRPQDQVRPVVGRDDLDARRQGGLELLELVLDALDDVERVLALPHDDDAGHDVAGAVQVGDAAPQVRTERRPCRRRGRARARRRRCARARSRRCRRPTSRSRGRAPCTRRRSSRPGVRRRRCCRRARPRSTLPIGMLNARRRFGSTWTWYCRTKPPSGATSATPGHGLQVVPQVPVLVASAARPGCAGRVVSTSAY